MHSRKFLALFIITSISLMALSLYNGYPLVENDSAAYIEQAIFPHFTPERTPFYGMFMRVSSMCASLWFTVMAQCFMLAYLLLKFIFEIQKSSASNRDDKQNSVDFNFGLVAVIAIITFTCVSWVTSCLMPDVFAGILLLSSILFVTAANEKPLILGVYLLFVFVAMLMHNSHFPIVVLFSLALLVPALIKKQANMCNRSLALLLVCGSVWGVMCSMNAIKKHGFTFSRGKDIMLTAKFAEEGILDLYLSDNCGRQPLRLCNYKGRIPGNITEFLTSGEGPVYKMGGWDSNRVEYKTIVHDVLTTPKYLSMVAQKSVVGTLKQLTQVHVADKASAQGYGSETWGKVKKYFAAELPAYTTSMQNNNSLSGAASNFIYYLFLVCSSLWMLICYQKVMSKELAFTYYCLFLFLVVNAFVTASLSAITYKFQYRVAWVLPATNAIVILRYYYLKLHSSSTTPQTADALSE